MTIVDQLILTWNNFCRNNYGEQPNFILIHPEDFYKLMAGGERFIEYGYNGPYESPVKFRGAILVETNKVSIGEPLATWTGFKQLG